MSVRLTWTNNSSGHDGTRIYRDTTPMDAEALPVPIDVVAAGVVEYVDSDSLADGTYYYRTQDYAGDDASAASGEVSVEIGLSASIGDEVEGGIYAGIITYADQRQFHIIAAKQDGEVYGLQWSDFTEDLGIEDDDDGVANTNALLADGRNFPAVEHCDSFSSAGFDDWYLPAINELTHVMTELGVAEHAEFMTARSQDRWSSTEHITSNAWSVELRNAGSGSSSKTSDDLRTRPVRRIPV